MGRELTRILALPVRKGWAGRELPPRTAALAGRLRPIQIEALAELETMEAPKGLFGEIGAGHGKTIPSLLAGYVLRIVGDKCIVIVPPDLVRKTQRDLETWRHRFPEGEGYWPKIMSSGLLSHPKHSGDLRALMPRLIVIDEAHQFAEPTSARTRRLIDYFVSFPDTRLVALSGTLSGKQIKRMAHLSELVLRDWSFLPTDRHTLETWATVLDYGAEPAPGAVKYLAPLAALAPHTEAPERHSSPFLRASGAEKDAGVEKARRGYTQRRITVPGVVATADAGVGASLYFRAWRPKVSEAVGFAINRLKEDWVLPDGTEIVAASDLHRHAITLSCGFYYKPIYSAVEDGPSVEEWMQARLEWGRALRRQLLYLTGYVGLDSPSLVIEACKDGRAHRDTIRAWQRWEEMAPLVKVSRETVWLDRGIVKQAVEAAQSRDRCLIWYSSKAIEEEFSRLGMTVHGAGSNEPDPGLSHAALSIHAHGTGKNLQAWAENILVEPPEGPQLAEQLIARTHRPGQRADAVYVDFAEQTWALRAKVYKLRRAARYLEETSVQAQRLCYGSWL